MLHLGQLIEKTLDGLRIINNTLGNKNSEGFLDLSPLEIEKKFSSDLIKVIAKHCEKKNKCKKGDNVKA